jgi:hypothetical protein
MKRTKSKMTMSVNDENSAGAANNNNSCKSELDQDNHYVSSSPTGLSRSALWPPQPLGPPGWMGTTSDVTEAAGPTYAPLVKVKY